MEVVKPLKLWNKETNPKKICAYCNYHKQHLTFQQVKRKGCLCKPNICNTCGHLIKLEHQIWVERELKKAQKKAQ
jgi:hypothetical protein